MQPVAFVLSKKKKTVYCIWKKFFFGLFLFTGAKAVMEIKKKIRIWRWRGLTKKDAVDGGG